VMFGVYLCRGPSACLPNISLWRPERALRHLLGCPLPVPPGEGGGSIFIQRLRLTGLMPHVTHE